MSCIWWWLVTIRSINTIRHLIYLALLQRCKQKLPMIESILACMYKLCHMSDIKLVIISFPYWPLTVKSKLTNKDLRGISYEITILFVTAVPKQWHIYLHSTESKPLIACLLLVYLDWSEPDTDCQVSLRCLALNLL